MTPLHIVGDDVAPPSEYDPFWTAHSMLAPCEHHSLEQLLRDVKAHPGGEAVLWPLLHAIDAIFTNPASEESSRLLHVPVGTFCASLSGEPA